jgi:hypothetical protein
MSPTLAWYSVAHPAALAVIAHPTAVTVLLDQVLTPAAVAAALFTQAPTAAMADSREAVQPVAAAGLALVELAAMDW